MTIKHFSCSIPAPYGAVGLIVPLSLANLGKAGSLSSLDKEAGC